jgi:citrate/tricarballylate utilization protein
MTDLQSLTRQAKALAQNPTGPETEVARQLQICNACRYCEGFCAVFPAMTRRLSFGADDTHYLANLCHNCGACLHACQYAPPHEFAVNLPQAMAKLRVKTYAHYAWPAPLGALYARNGLVLSLAVAAMCALFLLAAVGWGGAWAQASAPADFYSVFPHNLLVGLFGPVFLFALVALGLGLRRFWQAVASGEAGASAGIRAAAEREAISDVFTLRYLDGGHGRGCNNSDDAWTLWRRRYHHATFYGFMLCFASTSVATAYHYLLGWSAPYPLLSMPKLLGISGGVLLALGTLGLGYLNLKRHPLHGDPNQKPMDLGFVALLFLVSVSGLALWWSTGSTAMPVWLAIHLGLVMALFLTLPYNKFAHGVFRGAALLKWAIEKRLPNKLQLGTD